MSVCGIGLELQFEVTAVEDALAERRPAERTDPRDERHARGEIRVTRVTGPDVAGGEHGSWPDVGGEGRLAGRVREQVTPAVHDIDAVIERKVDLDGEAAGAGLVQAELEVRDDSEVAASAAQSPEQVGVLVG